MTEQPYQALSARIEAKAVYLPVGDLRVQVRVLEERRHFGRIDVRVEPVAGTGSQWVQKDRLEGTI